MCVCDRTLLLPAAPESRLEAGLGWTSTLKPCIVNGVSLPFNTLQGFTGNVHCVGVNIDGMVTAHTCWETGSATSSVIRRPLMIVFSCSSSSSLIS